MHYSVLAHLDFPQVDKASMLHPQSPFYFMAHEKFEHDMMAAIDTMVAPFDENTEEPEHLEFQDMSGSVRKDYEEKTLDMICLLDGSVVQTHDPRFYQQFTLEDGMVYQKNWGPLHHKKRTKKAKKMRVILNAPVCKVYHTMGAFAEDYYGYSFHETEQAYGYFSNPKGYYDWYQVGGRWPLRLLIPFGDPFYILGEKSWAVEKDEKKAPDGYRWVTGARKSAIQWDLMKSLAVEKATESFYKLEQWFITGIKPEGWDICATVTEEGIVDWGELVYKKDITLEQFLQERGLSPEQSFLLGAYYVIDDGEWNCSDEYPDKSESGDEDGTWRQYLEDHLEDLEDDAVIVTLDCHI